jgi:hypothetical protein
MVRPPHSPTPRCALTMVLGLADPWSSRSQAEPSARSDARTQRRGRTVAIASRVWADYGVGVIWCFRAGAVAVIQSEPSQMPVLIRDCPKSSSTSGAGGAGGAGGSGGALGARRPRIHPGVGNLARTAFGTTAPLRASTGSMLVESGWTPLGAPVSRRTHRRWFRT